jgi:RAD54-like protein 2
MHTNDRLNVRTREGKVIVNISEKNPNQVLYVADSIESVIKPHQIGGVRFLYDNIIESPSVYQSSPGKISFVYLSFKNVFWFNAKNLFFYEIIF